MVIRSLLPLLLIAPVAHAAGGPTEIGTLAVLNGAVTLTRAEARAPARRGETVRRGDTIETPKDGMARLLMRDESLLTLGPNTKMTFSDYRVAGASKRRQASLKLWVGRLWAKVTAAAGGDHLFQVETSNAVAGVRGTELVVLTDGATLSEVTVLSGSVEFGPLDGPRELFGPLEQGSLGAGGALVRVTLTAEQAQSLRRNLQPVRQLDAGGAEQRLQGPALNPPAADTPPPPAPPPEGADQPPLDLEPGIDLQGEDAAIIKGRIEVRE